MVEKQSAIDNLTAQLLSAEEMLEHKENDLRKLQENYKALTSEMETAQLLKQQVCNLRIITHVKCVQNYYCDVSDSHLRFSRYRLFWLRAAHWF